MSKHTPGPWSIEIDVDESEYGICNREHDGDDWDVATVHSTEANARLVAAAPEVKHESVNA